jgi:hypothetical protein
VIAAASPAVQLRLARAARPVRQRGQ